MLRWIFLLLFVLSFASCSFTSTSVFRGFFAPFGMVLFAILFVWAIAAERVGNAARGDAALMSDPETLRLYAERAKAVAARANQNRDAGSA